MFVVLRALSLLLVLQLVLGQPNPATVHTETTNDAGPGDNNPFTAITASTCATTQRVVFGYEITGFSSQTDDFLVFDLEGDLFNTPPSFTITFVTCAGAANALTSCGPQQAMGSITADPDGTTDLGDFQFAFRLTSDFTHDTATNGDIFVVIMEFDSPDSSDFVGTGAISNNANDFYFKDCGIATDDPSTATATATTTNVPGFQLISCSNYVPGCTIPTSHFYSTSPGESTDAGECFATLGVIEDPDLLDPSNGRLGVCPVTLTRDPVLPGTSAQFPVGANTHAYTVTNDINSQSETCSNDFAVVDDEPPQVFCPNTLRFSTDPDVCDAEVTIPPPPPVYATDNCADPVTIVFDPVDGTRQMASNDPYIYTLTASDDNVTPLTASCTFEVRVIDEQNPTFPDCPSDITAPAQTGRCSANVESMILANPDSLTPFDNCQLRSTSTNFPTDFNFGVGTHQFEAIATDMTDIDGFCRFTITIEDTQLPTIVCPNDITVDSARSSEIVSFNVQAEDNCPGDLLTTCNPPSNSRFQTGQATTVTCTAMDQVQQDSCSFEVRVNPTVPGISPLQTPIELPSKSPTNSPTRTDLISPQVSKDQVSPSESQTASRTGNPSISPSAPPSLSASSSRSSTPSISRSSSTSVLPIPESDSRTPTRTNSPQPSDTRSALAPTASPSRTPQPIVQVFEQQGTTTLVEVILQCGTSTCSRAEAEFYIVAFAEALNVDISDIHLEAIFGDEITFIVCDSDDVADLLNEINFGVPPPELAGSVVENAIFNVACPADPVQIQNQGEISSSSASLTGVCAFGILFIALL